MIIIGHREIVGDRAEIRDHEPKKDNAIESHNELLIFGLVHKQRTGFMTHALLLGVACKHRRPTSCRLTALTLDFLIIALFVEWTVKIRTTAHEQTVVIRRQNLCKTHKQLNIAWRRTVGRLSLPQFLFLSILRSSSMHTKCACKWIWIHRTKES